MSYKPLQYFSILFLAITLMRDSVISFFPIDGFLVGLIVAFAMISIVIWFGKKTNSFADSELGICRFYLFWLVVCIVRGFFVAANYWEYKQLVSGSLALSMPLFVFYFKDPYNLFLTLQKWNNWIPLLFICFLFWVTPLGGYAFLLTPFLFYGCFFMFLSYKWKIFVGVILIIMLLGDIGARSQVIKATATILCAIFLYLYKCQIAKFFWLKVISWMFFVGPIILLILGVSGSFNIFKDSISNPESSRYIQSKKINGRIVEENLTTDTRTFIYEEVFSSAINNDYVIWGRTPARGNDSDWFGWFLAENLKTGKYERHFNELCHLNVFTWLGLIGLLLHCSIYFLASYRAVYCSNNIFVNCIGVMVAFNWALGWIENCTRFDMTNLTIWIMISICLSKQFREMNDNQFQYWFKSLFDRKYLL